MHTNSFLSAKAFFESGKTLDLSFRKKALESLKIWILKNESLIADALEKDLEKSAFEAYMTEVGIALSELSFVTKKFPKWMKKQKAKTPTLLFPAKSYVLPRPYGVCLILSPWNYPFLLAVEPLISAIAAGNAVVLKPSLKSKNVADVLVKLSREALPEGLLQVEIGDHAIADKLLEDPFNMIFFTGSPKIGKHVMEMASHHLIPVVLELGGKSPCIVSRSANLALAAKRIAFGKLINAGQTCVAPDYVYADFSIKSELEALLVEEFKAYAPDGAKTKDFPKIIDAQHLSRLQNLVQGEKILCGGNSVGNKLAPTVLANVSFESPVMQEEIFGPVLPILTYKTEAEMIAKLKTLPRPLALYLFGRDEDLEKRIFRELHFGGATINDTLMHIASSDIPFGGVGDSGMGNYHGEAGFRAFSHYESVLDRGIWCDFKFRYPPFSEWHYKLLKFFLR